MGTVTASAGGYPDPDGGCCDSQTSLSWTDRPRSSVCRQDCRDHFCPDKVASASQWTSWWFTEEGHWATEDSWLDLVCIIPKNLPGDLPWSAVKYASLVTMSLLPEIYFWQSAMKNTCYKTNQVNFWIIQNFSKQSHHCIHDENMKRFSCRVHKEVEVV